MEDHRSSGILLAVSSLPGPYGIGSLGGPARRFVDFLAEAGQHYWQILPLVPPGDGSSPYMSPSAFAGNPYLIDLDELAAEGLLTPQELDGARWPDPDRVDYDHLAQTLNLKRVSAPLFVDPASGLNDDLNGVERPVSFDIPAAGMEAQVVHSLAKWKRMALYRYDFHTGKGIYADMNAIRRDEELDNLHSIYVDQWDWERVITREMRTLRFLQDTVRDIVRCISDTSLLVNGLSLIHI